MSYGKKRPICDNFNLKIEFIRKNTISDHFNHNFEASNFF